MKRHHWILLGTLVAQILLVVLVFWPRSRAATAANPAFPDLNPEHVTQITITDEDGDSLILARQAGEWVLPEADGFPADQDRVSEFLTKITELDTGRLVTTTAGSHKRLRVAEDDFIRRIDLETASGEHYELYLGSSPRYNVTHFRIQGQDETYLTDALATWSTNADPASWIDTMYLSVAESDLQAITLRNSHDTLEFTRDAEGNWQLAGLAEGEALDQGRVTSFVARMTSLNMQRPLGKSERPEYGLNAPQAELALHTLDKEIVLKIGNLDSEKRAYTVKSSESPYYVQVSQYSVSDLIDKTKQDFVLATPTPPATPATP